MIDSPERASLIRRNIWTHIPGEAYKKWDSHYDSTCIGSNFPFVNKNKFIDSITGAERSIKKYV